MKNAIALLIGSNRVIVNDQMTVVDTASPATKPLLLHSTTLVPLRFVSEQLGAAVLWDNETRSISIQMGDVSIKLNIGGRYMTVNNRQVFLTVTPLINNNRTFVPLRAISEAFGKDVLYDSGLITISGEPVLNPSADRHLIDVVISWFGNPADFERTAVTHDPLPFQPIKLPFDVDEAILHPRKPWVYLSYGNQLQLVDYQAGTVKPISLGGRIGTAGRMTIVGNELYVPVHTWMPLDMTPGYVVVLNMDTNRVVRIIDFPVNPANVVVSREGYPYVSMPLGSKHLISSFDQTGQKLDEVEVSSSWPNLSRYKLQMDYHPTLERVYAGTSILDFAQGKVVQHRTGAEGGGLLAPDGNVLFGNGKVLYADLSYAGNGPVANYYTFDPESGRIFISANYGIGELCHVANRVCAAG